MAHEDDAHAVIGEFGEGGDHAAGGDRVEHGGGFVAQQIVGLLGEGAAEAGTLELAVADLSGCPVQEVGVEPDPLREPVDVGVTAGDGGRFGDDSAQRPARVAHLPRCRRSAASTIRRR